MFLAQVNRRKGNCSFYHIFTGRNKVVAKVMFLQVCVCPQGGGCLPQCMLGCCPPDQADPPPRTRQDPPRPRRPPSPGPGRHTPPGTRQTHTPGKQTPAYGLRVAGTHPTGMHSCLKNYYQWYWSKEICSLYHSGRCNRTRYKRNLVYDVVHEDQTTWCTTHWSGFLQCVPSVKHDPIRLHGISGFIVSRTV